MAFEGFKMNPGPSFPPKSNTQFGNFPPSPPPPHSHSPSLSPPSSFYPFNHNTPSQRSPRFRAEMGSLFERGVPQAPQRGSHPMMLGRNPSNASYPFQEAQRPSLSPPRWGTHPKSFFNASNIQTHQGPASGVPYVDPLYAGTARHANFQDPRRTRSPSDNKVFLENYTRDVSERDLGAPQRLRSPPVSFNSSHSSEDPHRQFGEARRWPTEPSTFQAPKRTRSPPSPSANETIWKRSHSSQGDTDRDEASPPRLGNSSNLLGSNATSTVPQRSSLFSPHNMTEGAGLKTLNSQVPKRNRSPSLPSAEQALPGTSYSTVADTERETQAKAKRLARFGVELSQPVQKNIDHVKNKLPANRHEEALVERRKVVTDQPVEPGGDFMLSDYEGPESSSVIIGLCPDMCPELEREERERKGDLDKYERLDGDRNQSSLSLAVKKYNRTAEREADLIRPMPVLQKTIDYLLALLDHPYDDRFLGMYNFLWDRLRAIRMDLRMQHIFNQDAITMLEQMIRLHIVAMHELCEYTKGEGFSEGFDAHLNIEQMNKTSVELFQMYDDHRKKGSAVVSEKEFRGYYALLKLDKHPGYKVEPAELSLDLAKMTPEIRQTPEILFARDVARACRTSNFIAFFRLARKATYLQACLMHAHFAKLRTQALASLHSGLQSNQGIPITHVTKWLGMEEEDIDGLVEYHGFSIKEFEELYMVKEGPFLNSDKDYPTKCSQLVHLKKSTAIVDDVSSFHSLAWSSEISGQILPDKVVKSPLFDTVDEVMLTSEEDPAPTVGSPVQEIFELPTTGPEVRSVCQVAPVWVALSPKKSQDSAAAEVGKVGTPTRELFRNDSLERTLHSNAQGFSQQSVSRTTPLPMLSPQSATSKVVKVGTPTRETLRNDSLERTLRSNVQGFELKSITGTSQQSERSKGSSFHPWVESSIPQLVINPHENEEALIVYQEVEGEEPLVYHDDVEEEENMVMIHQDNEVATAKLKLLLRTWKRLSSKRKKLREQRQLEANAALSSLSLGPPIQQIRAPPTHVRELDIDRSVRERGERYRKSWTRLNISEVVGGMLSEKNPDAKCLCWKLVVCSPESVIEGDKFVQKTQSNQLASRWLHSKLMGVATENDDELVALSLDLSIWKKWVPHQYDRHPICCFSVIRTANLNMLEYTAGGAGAVLFLLSENIPLDHQKTQLHNLSMSLPSGSCVPLLILCGRFKEGSISPSMISNGLSLHYLDKTRISGFSVVSLMDDQPAEHLDEFFSTNRLKEGLQWLASQSFIQPVVHFIKTRDLVMDHLSSSLEMLENINISIVGPNHCISEFNQALDRSATEVYTAAETDPSSWPCPEISLLESSSDCRVVESFLPIIGWSSAAIIKPIVSRIQSCKLPFFPDDLSWLSDGSDMGEKILHHKSELKKCLIRYLTDLSQMMDKALGTTEACVMLQKGATLELQGSNYHITPKWVTIFRRIFNWRLMNLFSGVGSEAYILERRDPIVKSVTSSEEFNTDAYSPALHALESMEFEADGLCPFSLSQPSLDEMVGVCFSTCEFGTVQLQPEAIQATSMTVNHVKEPSCTVNADDDLENEENRPRDVESTQTGDVYLSGDLSRRVILDDYVSGELVLANKGKKEADKLSKLFEQCNIVQNKIDEHLSIYF